MERPTGQAVATGMSAAAIGYASSVAVVVAGLTAAGATPSQVSSALVGLGLLMALTGVSLSTRLQIPVNVVWSTPGVALLVAVGTLDGGFAVTVGAFLLVGLLIVLTGLLRPVTRLVALLPPPLTAAVLAGVLLPFCLQPARGVADLPLQAGAIAVVWLLASRFAPRWSAPAALLALVVVVLLAGDLPRSAARPWASSWCRPGCRGRPSYGWRYRSIWSRWPGRTWSGSRCCRTRATTRRPAPCSSAPAWPPPSPLRWGHRPSTSPRSPER